MNREIEILESIDNIDSCVQESAMDILDALIQEYTKLSITVDNTELSPECIQEGKILDEATGKDNNESMLFKIIAFLPRLLRAIGKSIVSVFTNDYKKDTSKNLPVAKKNLAQANADQLKNMEADMKEVGEDEVDFDPEKKQFFLKKGFRHVKNYIRIVFGLIPFLKKMKTMLESKGQSTSYATLAKEIRYILKGQKSVDKQTSYITLDMLKEMTDDCFDATRGVQGLMDEISMKIEDQMRSEYKKGNDYQKYADMKAVVDGIRDGCEKVKFLCAIGKIGRRIIKFVSGGTWLSRRIHNAARYDDIVDPELGVVKTEANEAEARAQAMEAKAKGMEDEYNYIKKQQKAYKKFKKKADKAQARFDKAKKYVDTTGQTIDDFRNKDIDDWGDGDDPKFKPY